MRMRMRHPNMKMMQPKLQRATIRVIVSTTRMRHPTMKMVQTKPPQRATMRVIKTVQRKFQRMMESRHQAAVDTVLFKKRSTQMD
jgi:hypothetical protein